MAIRLDIMHIIWMVGMIWIASLVTASIPSRAWCISVKIDLLWLKTASILYYKSSTTNTKTLIDLIWPLWINTNEDTSVLSQRGSLVDHSVSAIWSNDDVKRYGSRTELVQIHPAHHRPVMSPECLRVLSKLSRLVRFGQNGRFSPFFPDDSLKNVERIKSPR